MKPHQRYPSASMMHRLALCPGSWNFARHFEEEEDSSISQRGTRIHAELARLALDVNPPAVLSHEEAGVAESLWDRTTAALTAIYSMMDDEFEFVLIEERLGWNETTQQPQIGFTGQPDLIARGKKNPTHLAVVDYKTGFILDDESADNLQIRALVVLARRQFPDAEVIYGIIMQPGMEVAPVRYDMDAMTAAAVEADRTINDALDFQAPLVPSEDACKYCLGRAHCPALAKVVKAYNGGVATFTQAYAERAEAVGKALVEAKLAAIYTTSVEKLAKEMLAEDSESVAGWTIAPGQMMRSITSIGTVDARLAELGVTPEEVMSTCSMSIGALEEIVSKRLSLKGKKLREKIDELLAGAVEKTAKAGSLKRIEEPK